MSGICISYEKGYLYKDNLGNIIEYPDYFDKTVKDLRKLQKKAARQVAGSSNNKKTLIAIEGTKRKMSAQAKSFVGKTSNTLVGNFDNIQMLPAPKPAPGEITGIKYIANYNMLCRQIRQKQEVVRNSQREFPL